MKQLGKKIKDKREELGLKQAHIAQSLGVSIQAVSKWERNENAPDISFLPLLSQLLGVTIDWLLSPHADLSESFSATVLCTGIRGFANFSKKMEPKDLANFSNSIFLTLTETLVENKGIPIKYVGDGFLGFWHGKDHVKEGMNFINTSILKEIHPELLLCLHSGPIFVGSLGHPQFSKPDIMGDTVNTAFMLLSWLNESKGNNVLISETTCPPEKAPSGFRAMSPEMGKNKVQVSISSF